MYPRNIGSSSLPNREIPPSSQDSESKSINISSYLFRKDDMKLKQNILGGRLKAIVSQKTRSFRTFSKLLEALQYETALS